MTKRMWFGGSGDWFTAVDWTTAAAQTGVPVPGDDLVVAAGTITLLGSEAPANDVFNGYTLDLGSSAGAGTTLELDSAILADDVFVTLNGSASILATGQSEFDGEIYNAAASSVLTLGTVAGSGQASGLTLLTDAYIQLTDETVDITGPVTVESRYSSAIDTVVNSGTLTLIDTTVDVTNETGAGTVNLLLGGTFEVSGVTENTVNFGDVGADLELFVPAEFDGAITGFQAGDTIDLNDIGGDTPIYDPSAHTLTLTTANTGAVDAILQNVTAATGTLTAVPDGAGGTDIVYASGGSALSYQIAAGDRAMQSNVVRATMTVPGTSTPITGKGVKVGIISDSFDYQGTLSADPANAAAAAGYVPANANGTSAVQVVTDDDQPGATNEGLAMAELIHQVAPGATLAFASGIGTGSLSLQAAVAALQGAGCNIIVDDLSITPGPVYQVTGPVDQAVTNAIASGIDYFTAAANYGNDFLSGAFTPTAVTLSNGSSATANLFDNGTVYEGIDPIYGKTTLDLNWAAPYFGPSETGAPDELTMELFNASGQLVESSSQFDNENDRGVDVPVAEDDIAVPSGGPYTLAIIQNGATAPSQFLLTDQDQHGPIIEDPDVGSGSGQVNQQELIPAVNTVGAAPYAASPSFGATGSFPENFSDSGPGEILYASNGTPLSIPESAGKVDFVAPDGIGTSVVSPTGFAFAPFYGTSAAAPDAAAVAALMLQANPNLTTTQVTDDLEASAIPLTDASSAEGGAGLIQAPRAVELAEAVCFAGGTRIRTTRGEVAVEYLAVGDAVVTTSGGRRRIIWVGHRHLDTAYLAAHPDARPVRVLAGAFGAGVPARPLMLSPGHPVLVAADTDGEGGVLVPIMCLINGTSIARARVDRVTYWHVELDRHDILFADGLPAESFLDHGTRAWFANGAAHALTNPDHVPPGLGARCRPVALDGTLVESERRRVDALFATRLRADCHWPRPHDLASLLRF